MGLAQSSWLGWALHREGESGVFRTRVCSDQQCGEANLDLPRLEWETGGGAGRLAAELLGGRQATALTQR